MDLSSVRGLLTPSVLFLLLNLVIGTIAFISSRGPRNEAGPAPKLSRSPSSLLFERLKSFNLYSSHRPTEPQTVETPEPESETQPEPESNPEPEPDENCNITRKIAGDGGRGGGCEGG
ncbi:uncharacterized protein A4U43_C08F4850 [Asparagus officinalis]|nr:uncharacterized protein A4U43_C08F4850 [Asparagus officinalis]